MPSLLLQPWLNLPKQHSWTNGPTGTLWFYPFSLMFSAPCIFMQVPVPLHSRLFLLSIDMRSVSPTDLHQDLLSIPEWCPPTGETGPWPPPHSLTFLKHKFKACFHQWKIPTSTLQCLLILMVLATTPLPEYNSLQMFSETTSQSNTMETD